MLNVNNITVPMPWGTLAGRTFGEERAIPVLCVHGRSDNLETFSQLIPLLPNYHYYVCIDLPGHGRSAHADKGYLLDLLWYTMCVKRVVDHFKWSRLFFLGHSLGGQIGFFLAALYPELVLKLVIIDTLMYVHTSPPNTASALRDFLFDPTLKLEERSDSDKAPTYSLSEFVQKMKQMRHTEVTDEHIRAMAERNLTKVGIDQYKFSNDQRTKILGPILFTFDQLQNIARNISCPTLVILGKNSTATKPLNRLSRTPLQNKNNIIFVILEGDHDLHLTHAQEVASKIGCFITEGQSKL